MEHGGYGRGKLGRQGQLGGWREMGFPAYGKGVQGGAESLFDLPSSARKGDAIPRASHAVNGEPLGLQP